MNLTKFDGRTVSSADDQLPPKTTLRLGAGPSVPTVHYIISQAFPFTHHRQFLYPGLASPKAIALLMQRRSAAVRILKLSGASSCRPVGLIVTEGNRDYAEMRIHCVAVLPEFEALGLASRMVKYVVKTAEQSIIERESIVAYVPIKLPKRHRAARLFEGFGFQKQAIGSESLRFTFDCKASPRTIDFGNGVTIGKNRMAQYFADV